MTTKKSRRRNIKEEYGLRFVQIPKVFFFNELIEYLNQKRFLMDRYDDVTLETSAKNDFINIFQKGSIENLLDKVVITTNSKDKEEVFIPAQLLIQMILEKDENLPLRVEVAEDKSTVIYNYTGSKPLGDKSPVDYLIEEAKKNNVLESFIVDDTIRPLAQEQMLNDGINTKISIAKDFEYASINNKLRWYDANKVKENSDAKEAFQTLKKRYEISESLSRYESKAILLLYEQLSKQGHMAYQPINVAYGIKNATVAKTS